MFSRTREWLKQELNHEITEWESLNPLRKHATCIDLLTYGKYFYSETRHDDDLDVWDQAVTKVEAYVSNKMVKYHGVENQFRAADEGLADYFKHEKDKKTDERERQVKDHRSEIKTERFNKEFNRLKARVVQRQSTYSNDESKENLEYWQKDLEILICFAQHQVGSDQVKDFQDTYAAAAEAHQKKYSFKAVVSAKADSFCFKFFKCSYKEVEEEESQIPEPPAEHYRRMQ